MLEKMYRAEYQYAQYLKWRQTQPEWPKISARKNAYAKRIGDRSDINRFIRNWLQFMDK